MVNGTFFLQAVHFFLAYLIVERFLFRPALAEITADKLVKKSLQDAIAAQTHTVRALELSQQAARQQVSGEFRHMQPPPQTVLGGQVPQEIPTVPFLAQDQKTKLIDACVDALLKEVEHVH